MKEGDEVYLSPKSAYADGTECNPLGIKGKINRIAGRIYVLWETGRTNSYDDEDLILSSEYVPAMNQGHPNASILMEIAKEAAVNPEYWKEFEVKFYDEQMTIEWIVCKNKSDLLCGLQNDINIRRKPRTIRIGNYDVKKPVHLIAHKGCVSVFVETEEDAELMLKALQELLSKK